MDSTLAPIEVEILLCRCWAQKIGTDSGNSSEKKLYTINDAHLSRLNSASNSQYPINPGPAELCPLFCSQP